MLHSFYLMVDCGNCDAEILYGPCATTIEHRGMPVVMADIAEQMTFHCDDCGADTDTGELDFITEDGNEGEPDGEVTE